MMVDPLKKLEVFKSWWIFLRMLMGSNVAILHNILICVIHVIIYMFEKIIIAFNIILSGCISDLIEKGFIKNNILGYKISLV